MLDRAKLLASIEGEEGFRPLLYDDATGTPLGKGDTIRGNPTIAIGWCVSMRPLSHARAQIILGWHVDDTLAEMASLPWFGSLDDVRARAVADMAFQLGVSRLLQFAVMIAAIRVQAWNAAADAALDSVWASQVPVRARRIAQTLRTGMDAVPS